MEKIQKDGNILFIFDDKEVGQARTYWTPERIGMAQPVKMPCSESNDLFPDEKNAFNGTVSQADINSHPFNKVGRVYGFDDSTELHWKSSGQFCTDTRIILTTAHSLTGNNTHCYSKLNFFLQYNSGNYTSEHPLLMVGMRQDWLRYHQTQYDYAFAIVTGSGENGFLDFSLDFSGDTILATGYPSNYDNGEIMQKVEGTKCDGAVNTISMLGNPMGTGCSGGAWLQNNVIAGINAYKEGNKVLSPDFNEEFISLYEYIKSHL